MMLRSTPYSVVLRQVPANAPGCAFGALMRIKAAKMDDDTIGVQLDLD